MADDEPTQTGHSRKRAADSTNDTANKKAHTDGAAAAAASSIDTDAVTLPSWNAADWLRRFGLGDYSSLRSQVFTSTLEVIRRRGYRAADGTRVTLASCVPMQQGTTVYKETDSLLVPQSARARFSTRIRVQEGDCLEVARDLMAARQANDGSTAAAVLNMACPTRPGGGVLRGSGAQEENLFRRSALLCSLYPFATFAAQYADCHLTPVAEGTAGYPIETSGGIYTPATQVFRSAEKGGYALLPQPYEVAFLTVPAIDRRQEAAKPLSNEEKRTTEIKIRAMLRIAATHGHIDLVLSAFGCGAFGNPPAPVAALFATVLAEAEFSGVFRELVFAIFDDHNARKSHNPEGNLKPFQQQFDGAAKGASNQ